MHDYIPNPTVVIARRNFKNPLLWRDSTRGYMGMPEPLPIQPIPMKPISEHEGKGLNQAALKKVEAQLLMRLILLRFLRGGEDIDGSRNPLDMLSNAFTLILDWYTLHSGFSNSITCSSSFNLNPTQSQGIHHDPLRFNMCGRTFGLSTVHTVRCKGVTFMAYLDARHRYQLRKRNWSKFSDLLQDDDRVDLYDLAVLVGIAQEQKWRGVDIQPTQGCYKAKVIYPSSQADEMIIITALIPDETLDALENDAPMIRKAEFTKSIVPIDISENDLASSWRNLSYVRGLLALFDEGRQVEKKKCIPFSAPVELNPAAEC